MDEVKFDGQERLDLTDLNRLKQYVHEAISDAIKQLFGFANYKSSNTDRRPIIVENFTVAKLGGPPTLTIRVTRSDTGIDACVYDKDGKRVSGKNSQTYSDITVSSLPESTTRYLQARWVATNDLLESRIAYSSTSGRTTVSQNTRTRDGWEIQDNTVSAKTDETTSAAGWIDIATFQTNDATSNITVLTAEEPFIEQDRLVWTGGGTVAPDDPPLSIADSVGALRQIVAEMRAGTDTLSTPRTAYHNPLNDACFEEEGGLRFGSGDTEDNGRRNLCIRSNDAGSVLRVVDRLGVVDTDTADYLRLVRCKAITARNPNPALQRGFIYNDTDIGSIQAIAQTRRWWVSASEFTRVGAFDPTINDSWHLKENYVAVPTPVELYWDFTLDVVKAATPFEAIPLHCTLRMPPGSRLKHVFAHFRAFNPSAQWTADFSVVADVWKKDVAPRGSAPGYYTATSLLTTPFAWGWDSGTSGYMRAVTVYDSSIDVSATTEQEGTNMYGVNFTVYKSGSVTTLDPGTYVYFYGLLVDTEIREASHIY